MLTRVINEDSRICVTLSAVKHIAGTWAKGCVRALGGGLLAFKRRIDIYRSEEQLYILSFVTRSRRECLGTRKRGDGKPALTGLR